MNLLLLRGFNNYFNRIVKKYSLLQDYRNAASSYLDLANINFNPNDGVATVLIIGSTDQKEANKPLDWENIGTPDYLVCYDGDPSEIKSRWFILESERTRNGQYKIALKRDVLAEHFDKILTAPCFVEKGYVYDTSSTLLFNKENMTYNQIKENEWLLKDKTDTGWIIGYTSQDAQRYPASDYYRSTSPVAVYDDVEDLPQWIQDILGKKLICIWPDTTLGGLRFELNLQSTSAASGQNNTVRQIVRETDSKVRLDQSTGTDMIVLNKTSNVSDSIPVTGVSNPPLYEYFNWSIQPTSMIGMTAKSLKTDSAIRSYFYLKKIATIITGANEAKKNLSDSDIAVIKSLQSRYIKKDNKIYKINLIPAQREAISFVSLKPTDLQGTSANQAIWNILDGTKTEASNFTKVFFGWNAGSYTSRNISVSDYNTYIAQRNAWQWDYGFNVTNLEIALEEVNADDASIVKVCIPATRQQCYDAPMDVFAIPFGTFDINHYSYGNITMSKEIALQAACALGQAGTNVYDIQILPYFPTIEYIGESANDTNRIFQNKINIADNLELVEDRDYSMIKNNELGNIGIIFWCRNTTFTFDIDSVIEIEDYSPIGHKVSNETDLWRLVSPNYNGQFEFSIAKSGGSIEKFNIDCTYKPYNPYIHVTPYLSGLYGRFAELDDARGLICGGDFSLSRITSAWEQYQLNNKNYQEIFDREIKHLDVNNQIAKEQQNFAGAMGIVTGTMGGAGAGAIAGSKLGPYGAAAGAVVGGATGLIGSAAGYGLDMDWLDRSQREARSYAIDMFGYQLGNIQAMPNSLAKTTSMTNNNRIFPFVEYYTATDEEKEILRSKIEYDGMTIMALGQLNNFSDSPLTYTYLQGKLVRLDNIDDDFHVVDAIYQEVSKGFYV